MAKRLGETLVERGAITRGQLARALKAQLISGGHLGTSLIELGFIDEETLGRTLADCLHLRYAPAQMFEDIAPSVIGMLSPDVVERHRVIPLGYDQGKLHAAVVSPRALSSLSVRTGFRFVPWVAPEFRILEAMQRYYRIPLRPRFLSLARVVSSQDRARPKTSEWMPTLSPLEERALHAGRGGEQWLAAGAAREAAVVAAVRADAAVHAVQLGAPEADGQHPPGLPESPAPSDRPAKEPARHEAAPEGPPVPHAAPGTDPDWSLDELSFLITQSDSRDELCSVVLAFAVNRLSACALFGTRDDSAYAWGARGLTLPKAGCLPLTSNSVFELLLGHEVYCGPVPRSQGCRRFYATLQRDPPEELLLVPVHLDDRLVAILYGEGKRGKVAPDLDTYLRVAQKFALGLNMVLLKARIESV